MSWLLRFALHSWTTCTPTYEAEGWSVLIVWRSFVIELAAARKERTFPEEAPDGAR